MFKFTLLSKNENRALIKVQCFQYSNYNIERLEVYHNGTWYTPTKSGLNTLTESICDDKIRRMLITELHNNFRI